MEYNKIQSKLQDYIFFYEKRANVQNSIKWDEYTRLSWVYKNNYITEELKERVKYLDEWMQNIDKEVYLSNNSFNYALVDTFSEIDLSNQKYFDTTKSITFTQEVFDKLCSDYCEYQVKRLTEELLEQSITSNSTCKMTNLVFEWRLECKQILIGILKDLVKL